MGESECERNITETKVFNKTNRRDNSESLVFSVVNSQVLETCWIPYINSSLGRVARPCQRKLARWTERAGEPCHCRDDEGRAKKEDFFYLKTEHIPMNRGRCWAMRFGQIETRRSYLYAKQTIGTLMSVTLTYFDIRFERGKKTKCQHDGLSGTSCPSG